MPLEKGEGWAQKFIFPQKIKGSANSEMRLQNKFLSLTDVLFEVLTAEEKVKKNLKKVHIFFWP